MGVRLKLTLLLIAFSIWLYGVFDFYQMTQSIVSATDQVDGIVILTGGHDRIKTGLEQIVKLNASRILISGVSKVANLNVMQRRQLNNHNHLLEHIDIGYGAVNTLSNALESAIWVKKHDFKCIGLVTSRFHLPRSLLLFQKVIDDVKIYPIVVDANDSTFFHLLKEFHKYYLVRIFGSFIFEQEASTATL